MITVFWDIAPCILVEAGRIFSGAYCLIFTAMIEAVRTSEMFANF
jgi:hypothetical protein